MDRRLEIHPSVQQDIDPLLKMRHRRVPQPMTESEETFKIFSSTHFPPVVLMVNTLLPIVNRLVGWLSGVWMLREHLPRRCLRVLLKHCLASLEQCLSVAKQCLSNGREHPPAPSSGLCLLWGLFWPKFCKIAQIQAIWRKSKQNGPNRSEMAQIWSESRYWRHQHGSLWPKWCTSGQNRGFLARFGLFCLNLGHFT